ncbi:glycosyltransferase family 25 protein [Chromatiaceae bacterium AAb-1]|nr:glycosyltransferase family 25 protein [Chromatiaceae bacterium AAb-1]
MTGSAYPDFQSLYMTAGKHLPIFIINLDSSPERYQSASKQLAELDLSAERFSGVYGKNLSAEQVDACYDRTLNKSKFRRPLSPGEIGCYLSHRALWQKMVDDNIPVAVILEDDIEISAGFVQALQQLSRLSNWDMIKISDDRNGQGEQRLKLDDTYTLVNFRKVPNCTTAYAITLQGAKKLLSRKKFFRPVDVDLQFYPELDFTVYSILPYVVRSSPRFVSEINAMSGGTRKGGTTFWRNLRYRLQLASIRKRYLSGDLSGITFSD